MPPEILNHARLADLLGEDRATIAEILDLAVGTCRKALGALSGMDAATPPAEIARAAHAMKGAAINVGAEALSSTAAALEDRARKGEVAGLDASVEEISREFARFEGAVRSYHEAAQA